MRSTDLTYGGCDEPGCSQHIHDEVPWIKGYHEKTPAYLRKHAIGPQYEQLEMFDQEGRANSFHHGITES